jgi:hypothetical protein
MAKRSPPVPIAYRKDKAVAAVVVVVVVVDYAPAMDMRCYYTIHNMRALQ